MAMLGTLPAEASSSDLRINRAARWKSAEITVSAAVFHKFQQLIYRESGIWLSEAKTALLCGRLARRLRTLELHSMSGYYELVASPEQHAERTLMIDAITTNETRFFREPKHFEYLADTVFPTWRKLADQGLRSRTVRIWSAGCSSGEEAYSLAMIVAKHLPDAEGWQPRILATDISTRVLATAREGVYRMTSSLDIPQDLLREFMLKGHSEQEGKMKVGPEIRNLVDFKHLNLGDDRYKVGQNFDAIFCRNVLIYFDAVAKRNVVEKLLRHLSPDGFFFIGHAENLHSVTRGLRSVSSTVYVRKNERSDLQKDS